MAVVACSDIDRTKVLAYLGNAAAQNSLGLIYYEGEGVPEDHAEAAKWYRKAADQGNANAQHSLGVTYAKGEGVPEDYVNAHKWFNLAAAAGNEDARRNLKIMAGNMNDEQIAEAQRLAREWHHAHLEPMRRTPVSPRP